MDWPTFAGFFLGSMVGSVISHLIGDEIKRGLSIAFKKLSAMLKRAIIALIHHIFHVLPVSAHSDPLFVCLDKPCDMLFVDMQALEPPEEPEVFDS